MNQTVTSNNSYQNLKIQLAILGLGISLLFIKSIAYWITSSNSILSDALESNVNILTGIFGLYSLYLAAQPKDLNHLYGHGKIEFFSSWLEGFLILFAGIAIIVKSIYNIWHPAELKQLDLGITLSIVTGSANYFAGWFAVRKGKEKRSMTLIGSGEHLKSDAYSTAGLVLGLILVRITNWFILDTILAIFFGCIIIKTGYQLIRTSVSGLMDETDNQLIFSLTKLLSDNRKPDWIDIHNLRMIRYGSNLHIDCHLTLPWYYDLRQVHDQISEVEKLVSKEFVNVELFIHPDPCLPSSCAICGVSNCPQRLQPFNGTVKWTMELLLKNQKHSL
ncbi:MAG: cation diffusion facilitator family transporter [Bacteroidia bacterium]|nr:cation diffusion facilitator family transporter [Bacteroidia bacterium]